MAVGALAVIAVAVTAYLIKKDTMAGVNKDRMTSNILNKKITETDLEFLKCEGNQLVTESGKQVLLRGVNLGGWLIQEAWMCPLKKEDKGWGTWDTRQVFLERGFSEEQILEIMETYETNWITEKDLDNIKEMGLNCVRVPFWYGNFQKDDVGTYYSEKDMNNNPGFQRLDWLLDECGKRRIYVVLDMHGAPGFQNDDHSSGKTGSSQLFNSSKEGQLYRNLTVELWKRIATRYAGNPVVAAYDLLNEPMNGFEGSRKNDPALWHIYHELYLAIREVDPGHIITMEGIWEMHNLPNPSQYNWTNVIYQTHNYNWRREEIDQKIKDIKDRKNWNVPVYVGEFQSEGIWDYALKAYNENQISWTTWTYKGVKSTLTGWFIYCSLTTPLVDPEIDSYEEILEKWSKVSTLEESFKKDEYLAGVLKKYARE